MAAACQETDPDHHAVVGDGSEIVVRQRLALPSVVCFRLALGAQIYARAVPGTRGASIREEDAACCGFLAAARAGLLGSRRRNLGGLPMQKMREMMSVGHFAGHPFRVNAQPRETVGQVPNVPASGGQESGCVPGPLYFGCSWAPQRSQETTSSNFLRPPGRFRHVSASGWVGKPNESTNRAPARLQVLTGPDPVLVRVEATGKHRGLLANECGVEPRIELDLSEALQQTAVRGLEILEARVVAQRAAVEPATVRGRQDCVRFHELGERRGDLDPVVAENVDA